MKLEGFDKLLDDVAELEAELAAPASFYAAHREVYFRQAVAIAKAVLTVARPPDTRAEDWQRKIERIAGRITTELLAGGDGLVFSVGESGDKADGARPTGQAMSFQDIRDWIQAGIEGKPGGKRITAIDQQVFAEKGIDGVASIVMKAYYSLRPDPRYARLRAAIQRYFLSTRQTESTPLLDAIATAWQEHFAVVIPRDLERYAAGICRRF